MSLSAKFPVSRIMRYFLISISQIFLVLFFFPLQILKYFQMFPLQDIRIFQLYKGERIKPTCQLNFSIFPFVFLYSSVFLQSSPILSLFSPLLSFKPAGSMEQWKGHRTESPKSWIWVLAGPLISCVIVGKLLHLWGPWFPFLYNEEAGLNGKSLTVLNTMILFVKLE